MASQSERGPFRGGFVFIGRTGEPRRDASFTTMIEGLSAGFLRHNDEEIRPPFVIGDRAGLLTLRPANQASDFQGTIDQER